MSKLTEEERRIVSVAKVGASHEEGSLIKIIERLCGETIKAADESSIKDPSKNQEKISK